MKGGFLIIDSHAVLHRAYHAMPPLTNKKGEPIGAVYGYFSVLISTLKEIKPEKLAVCFDYPAPTFRHEQYFAYQAKRPPMEDKLASQINKTWSLVKEAKIARFKKSGFEADDLAGTLAKKSRAEKVYILTGDKDLMQLVDQKTNLLLMQRQMSKFTIVNPLEVKNILGVLPNQVVDYKGLAGDSSDNYPGVPGVGPKTTLTLLSEFKTFKKVYQNLDKLPESLQKKLKAGKDAGELSLKLAKIINKVPFKIKHQQLAWKDDKIEGLKEILGKEGFKSLVGRIEKNFGLEEKINYQQQLL